MGKINIPIARLEKAKKTNPQRIQELYSIGTIVKDTLVIDRAIYISDKKYNESLEAQPSIARKVSKLGRSMLEWAGNKFVKVDESTYNNRLSVCRQCKFWVENGNIGFGKCKICGCGRGKLWLGHEKCPIGKWQPLTPPPSV
jgi:hypothetical protein